MTDIRYADITDAKTLGEIHALSWKEAYKGIIGAEILEAITPERREVYFRRALTEGWEEDGLICRDGKPAGLISMGKSRDEDCKMNFGEIRGLYLHPLYWEMGLGRELMEWGMKELKSRGYSGISLWVLEGNLRARGFYEKMGFRYDGTVKEITIGRPLRELRYEMVFQSGTPDPEADGEREIKE